MYQAQQQVPPYDRWDQSTINQNLPAGNDVWPNIQEPPNLVQHHRQSIGSAIAKLRTLAQTRLFRQSPPPTPIHILTYNMLSQNRFVNQEFSQWAQRTVDFLEFLIVAQNNPPHTAEDKAANMMYRSMLATYAGMFPQVAQMCGDAVVRDLQEAGRTYQDIMRDIQSFHAAGRRPMTQAQPWGQPQQPSLYGQAPQQYGQPPVHYGQSNQLPPVHATYGYHQPQQQYGYHQPVQQPNFNTGQMAPGGYTPHTQAPTPSTGGVTNAPVSSGRYLDNIVSPKEAQEPVRAPIESWGSGSTYTQSSSPTEHHTASQTSMPHTDLPVPVNLDDIVLDPHYYIPPGVTVDSERPYDEIHNPGGVVIKPAHLSGWKRTRSDVLPYSQGYDINKFVLFHVKWPDNVVQELIVEWREEMEYLKHETDEAMKSLFGVPKGELVVSSSSKIVQPWQWNLETKEPINDSEMEARALDEFLNHEEELEPVVLDQVLVNSTDMENELEALEALKEHLGLDMNVQVVPSHEYRTVLLYPMNVPSTVTAKLQDLVNSSNMEVIAIALQDMSKRGELPVRYFRFLDERLTKAVNNILSDNLSMGNLSIDSFCEDISALFEVLRKKGEKEVVEVFNQNTKVFANRWLSFVIAEDGDDEGQFSLHDEFINLQTGWSISDLGSLQLSDVPVLLSEATHPKLHAVVHELFSRNSKAGMLSGRTVRLITNDGVYLELIRGWLVKGSVLVKLYRA